MISIDTLDAQTLEAVVDRVVRHQLELARRNPLINGSIDRDEVGASLSNDMGATTVARLNSTVVGHLTMTTVINENWGHGAWINPGSLSYDSNEVLRALYIGASPTWAEAGLDRHYVWVPPADEEPWRELGFARMHQRGTMRLVRRDPRPLPTGLIARSPTLDDLDDVVSLSAELWEWQSRAPSFGRVVMDHLRDDWAETLEDETARFLVIEEEGHLIAQCGYYPSDPQVGSFANAVDLVAVTVTESRRGQGLGAAMVDHLFQFAIEDGVEYAETNWRVTNLAASRMWRSYGFTPTYLRLHRPLWIA